MRFIKRASVNTLVNTFMGCSLVMFLTIFFLFNKHYISKNLFLLLVSVSFFIFGCSGIPIIVRKETPTFFLQPFGKGETLTGIFLALLGFIPSLYIFIIFIVRLLHK